MDFVKKYSEFAPHNGYLSGDIEKAIYAYDRIEPRFTYPEFKSLCFEMDAEGVRTLIEYITSLLQSAWKPIVTFHIVDEYLSRAEITSKVNFRLTDDNTNNLNILLSDIGRAVEASGYDNVQTDLLYSDDANIIVITLSQPTPYYVSVHYIERAVRDPEKHASNQREFELALLTYILKASR